MSKKDIIVAVILLAMIVIIYLVLEKKQNSQVTINIRQVNLFQTNSTSIEKIEGNGNVFGDNNSVKNNFLECLKSA